MRKIILAAEALLLMVVAIFGVAENAPCPSPVNFAGIRTFLSAPYVPRIEDLKADIAVVGVPFDEGTWNAPGTRYGPRELREGTAMYKMCDLAEGFYYIDGDRVVLKGKHWADLGDVETWPTVPKQTDDNITRELRAIMAKKAFPVVLGGDHSITFPVLRAYDLPLTLIHFDAHLDTWTGAPGNLDHASWVNRAAQLSNVKHIVQIGMRGLANDFEARDNFLKLHNTLITSEQIHRRGVEWALSQVPKAENIYISIDVDVLDPAVAPGTGTLEPGGLSFFQLDDLLTGVASKGRLIGVDVVEVDDRDHSGRTAQTADRLLIDLLGAALH
ncbi:MAG: arginase family protein [Acidobacteriaceae bacterium]|nr:arginase family protein [Acidobacteriaceae bacterium]